MSYANDYSLIADSKPLTISNKSLCISDSGQTETFPYPLDIRHPVAKGGSFFVWPIQISQLSQLKKKDSKNSKLGQQDG